MAPSRLNAWLRSAYLRPRNNGEPHKWSVSLFAPRGNGTHIATGVFPNDGGVDGILASVESDIDNHCTMFVEGVGEDSRFSVVVHYRDTSQGVDTDSISTVVKYEAPVKESKPVDAGAATATLVRGQAELTRALVIGMEAKDRAMIGALDAVSSRANRLEERVFQMLEKIIDAQTAEGDREVKLLRIEAKNARMEKAIEVIAPHVGDVVAFLKDLGAKHLLGAGGGADDMAAKVKAFVSTLNETQVAAALEIFGMETLAILQTGDLMKFIETAGKEKMQTFASKLTSEQKVNLSELAKGLKV